MAKYIYDAWGNCTISGETTNTALAHANPIRYRGYYYDDDTGLYYCNARYYSPKWRRFISPDDTSYLDPDNVNGLNLYCYCNNDPVNFVDPSGHLAFFVLTAIIGAAVGIGVTAAVDYISDGEFNLHWGWYVGAGLLGAAIGAGFGMAVSYYVTGSVLSSTSQVFNGLLNSVSLYRTVGPNELTDLKTTKMFRSGRTSMDGKYFAKTRRGARKWMTKFKQSNYVRIRVAKNKLSHDSVWIAKHLDAIDDAFYFSDLDYLNTVVNGIWVNGSSFIQF